MNYENDIHIDETALDVEWLEQPNLMLKYTKHAATLKKLLDKTKEKLDFTRAELDKDIRTTPEKFDITKVTEGAIQATILNSEVYKEMNNELIELQFEYNIAQGALRAIDARKDALENLVRLHALNWFSGPKVPRDLQSEVEKRRKAATAAVGKMTRTPLER